MTVLDYLQFRERLSDIIQPNQDDFYLIKWLKARQFDVDKAEAMFRASMDFREEMDVEKIYREYDPPEVIKKYLTGGFCGHDKEGSPIRIELYGRLDIKGIMCSVKKSDLVKIKIKQFEGTVKDWEQQSKKLGRRVDGMTVIVDMDGVGPRMMWSPGMQMHFSLVQMLEDNYPEMLKRLFVIKAPGIFPLLYKLAKPLISEDTKNKIHILGNDYKSTLLKYIDPEELPAFLGGTQTDEDRNPRCVSKICQGGLVPEEYYLENTEYMDHLKTVTVPRGEKYLVEHIVETPGSYLRWEFKTDDYDIGFAVLKKQSKGNAQVVPMSRMNSHVVTQDGSYTCQEPGTYYVCFDNSFSWTRSKKIYYHTEVLVADETIIKYEINDLIENGDWKTLCEKYETTHL
ncbi:hypothetical protein KUTeg_010102 [Tegillarca granosa]|uniref:Retinal-binding protein n=1 Tax=Tegillarca granosa TaxID=220873 RepID=A0ABQ9F5S1_TEGGR|nr:hypothetical protein KUTeg_010102 [Tegillarca granosa]